MATMTRNAPKVKAKKSAPVVSLALAIDHQVYQVEPIPAGEFGTKAFRLEKKSTGAVHDVIRTNAGLVECSCPSYEVTYRNTLGTCKHGSALVAMGLLDAPSAKAVSTPAPIAVAMPAEELATISVGFAAELVEAVGLPVLDAPAEELPAEVDAKPCCDPSEVVPCGTCDAHQATEEPIGWAKAPKIAKPALVAPKPVRIAPLPDGRYTLTEIIEGQAAMLRGQGGPVFGLMAKALDELAATVRATGAQSVAEFEDRLEVLEFGR